MVAREDIYCEIGSIFQNRASDHHLGDHFLSTNRAEVTERCERHGYFFLGILFWAFTINNFPQGAIPVYRKKQTKTGNHLLTTNKDEANGKVFRQDGQQFMAFDASRNHINAAEGTVVVRWHKGGDYDDHYYAIKEKHTAWAQQNGYHAEGHAFIAFLSKDIKNAKVASKLVPVYYCRRVTHGRAGQSHETRRESQARKAAQEEAKRQRSMAAQAEAAAKQRQIAATNPSNGIQGPSKVLIRNNTFDDVVSIWLISGSGNWQCVYAAVPPKTFYICNLASQQANLIQIISQRFIKEYNRMYGKNLTLTDPQTIFIYNVMKAKIGPIMGDNRGPIIPYDLA